MRPRPTLIAALLAATLAAGCSVAVSPPAGSMATTATPERTSSAAPTAGTTGNATAPAGRPTTTADAPATTSSRPDPITVVAPSGASTTPASPTTTSPSAPIAVTTIVTVTPPATTPSPTSSRTPSPATPPTVVPSGALAGKVVVIDPGHNGANAAHPEIINKQVPAGFGQYKACNTTGTATNAGYPEYRFTWNTALALREILQAKGITVVMTRNSDDGVGPCVNERAAIGNKANADAVISIHGDGEAANVRGFYVMTAGRAPAGAAMAAQSLNLARNVRNGLQDAGFPTSNTLGQQGLWTRSDLAGLNLSERPTVMIECGNMRNATEAGLMSSASGQQRYAQGLAAGVIAFLTG